MAPVDIDSLTLQEKRDLLFKAGILRHLLLPHQLPLYKRFHDFRERSKTDAYKQQAQAADARFHNLTTWLVSRRFGKSSVALICGVEEMIRKPGSAGIIAYPTRAMLGAVVKGLLADIFHDAPEGYKPELRASWQGLNDVIVLPATGSYARLVGLDLHADRLRGTALDWAVIGEASFCSFDLDETYRSAIAQQFRGRPDSFCIVESSYASTPDHPAHAVFALDAAKRDALQEYTILDQGLSEEEIRYWCDQSGGPDHPTTRRELFGEFQVDRDRALAPSFTPANVVPRDYPLPQYGLGLVGYDPGGFGDQAGLVFAVVDPSRKQVIVQSSAGLRAATTDELAELVREREKRLWGTTASTAVEPPRTLRDIMKGPRLVPRVDVGLEQLSIDALAEDQKLEGVQVLEAPEGALTWWSDFHASLRPNPYTRLSDVAPQQLADLRARQGLTFHTPSKGKGNMDAQLTLLNDFLREGSLLILDNEENQVLIKQLRSCRWNKNHTDIERTAAFGHADVLVALAILLRGVRWDVDPRRPQNIHSGPGYFTPPSVRELLKPLPPPGVSTQKRGREVRGKTYGR